MAAEDVTAEALARIEHKMDMILSWLRTMGNKVPLAQMGEASHNCPICSTQVSYYVDIMKKVVVRKCNCKTGKMAPIDLSLFEPPAIPAKREEDEQRNQEDRNDPNRRGRDPGRR